MVPWPAQHMNIELTAKSTSEVFRNTLFAPKFKVPQLPLMLIYVIIIPVKRLHNISCFLQSEEARGKLSVHCDCHDKSVDFGHMKTGIQIPKQ